MRLIIIVAALATLSFQAFAEKEIFITIGTDAVPTSKSFSNTEHVATDGEISVMKISPKDVELLSHEMHEKFHRCGGFVVHESEAEAKEVLSAAKARKTAKNFPFVNYSITEGETVRSMTTKVSEFNIRDMIIKMSAFHNRYYKSQTGVDSQAFVKKTWENLSVGRSDVSVEYFNHTRWPQPSIIMTIEGNSKKDEIVVIGGHADSIAGFFGKERARAPGADDNASGISTITEVIRVLMDSNYKPERTIQFMAYAAEEVGLLGSKAIANKYKSEGKQVVGVVQFDMTNHKGTEDLDIVFMTDFTNDAQTKFMGSLIDTYLTDVKWGYSKCGYGCSDHASWHNAGYPASMPFESTMGDINRSIHTAKDLIEARESHGTADHAEKFARLGVSFIVEMGK